MSERVLRPKDLADHFLAAGRYTFTLTEAQQLLQAKDAAAVYSGLSRLRRRHEVFSPAHGLYVAVPPEYRNRGVVPAEWFVDAMMGQLGRPYYVGLLSAAAMYGAAHQAPQVFQVVTDRTDLVRKRDLGRVRLRFYSSKHIFEDPTTRFTVPSGYVVVGTKETTVVDLVGKPRASGGLSNVATILRELGELREWILLGWPHVAAVRLSGGSGGWSSSSDRWTTQRPFSRPRDSTSENPSSSTHRRGGAERLTVGGRSA